MPRRTDVPCIRCGKLTATSNGSAPPEHRVCQPCRRIEPVRGEPKMALARACELCGGSYTCTPQNAKVQRFCSRQCANAWNNGCRPPYDPADLFQDCEVCGQRFKRNHNAVQRTCRRECGLERRRRNSRRTRWPSSKIYSRECLHCGRLFTARRSTTKVCGKECFRLWNIQRTSAAISARYRTDPEFRAQLASRERQRRATKLGAPGQITSPADLIGYLTERDHGRCGICGKPVRAKQGPMRPSIDHIVPLTKGGEHTLENVQLAHFRCNLSKGNRGGGQILLVG